MTTSEMPQNASNPAKQPVVGVLLVHGLNGTTSDFAELEQFLRDRGMVTNNILLPGHGVHVRELMSKGWSDWEKAVREELNTLKQRCDVLFLVGHSLGGALVLHVAAHEEVAGLVSMCAPLYMHPWTAFAVRLAKGVAPLLPSLGEDVHWQIRRRHKRNVYRWMPVSSLESMLQFLPQLRAELPTITIPALVMTSIYDHVVPARDGREIYKLLGSQEKYLVTFRRSYHVIMKDHDRNEVFAKTAAFITRYADKARPVVPEEQTA